MTGNLPDVAETIKAARGHLASAASSSRSGIIPEGDDRLQLIVTLTALLESLSARVTQAETEVADRCAHIVRTTETTSGAMGWYEQKALADAANRIDAAFAQPAPGTENEASNG